MQVKGIARSIVVELVERTRQLGQGRNVGCFGFLNGEGLVDSATPPEDGGLGGIPLRRLLNRVVEMRGLSLLEGLENLPPGTVFINTRPGKTGLITDVFGVDFFYMPVICLGVKEDGLAGVGLIEPRAEYFDLASEAERLSLATLTTRTMDEERQVLRRENELGLAFLDLSHELPVLDLPRREPPPRRVEGLWRLPRRPVGRLDSDLARELVDYSLRVGQGREVAVMGRLHEDGTVRGSGKMVAGGMGYVPSRLLASSAVPMQGHSLREAYRELIDPAAVLIHTHPGGTGVMHIGDAGAGPGSWGRPIIAIGHDEEGQVRGATVLEAEERLFALADEEEELNQRFFGAGTPEEEAAIRNRKFAIAQEYTGLCRTIELAGN